MADMIREHMADHLKKLKQTKDTSLTHVSSTEMNKMRGVFTNTNLTNKHMRHYKRHMFSSANIPNMGYYDKQTSTLTRLRAKLEDRKNAKE
jgi:hypothetical protein